MRDGFDIRNFNESRPKLPACDEQKDEMDAYLERYEQIATSQEWDAGDWEVSLSSLFTGKGLQVHSSMPQGDVNHYCRDTSLLKTDFVGNLEKTNWNLAKQCFSL